MIQKESGCSIRSAEETTLLTLFNMYAGKEAFRIRRLPGAGSGRRYYRLTGPDGFTAIGAAGDNITENRAFCALTKDFSDCPVPLLYAVADDFSCYLQEDLCDTSLYSLIGKGGAEKYLSDALRELARMQCVPEGKWAADTMHGPFSLIQVMWDLNYFKYEFVKVCGVDFDEQALEDDFGLLASRLVEASKTAGGFMYRDFQSRNVMIKDGRVRFIDYQGGRKGPSLYDAVSFLWQAKASLSDDLRRRMLDVYADGYCRLTGISRETLLRPLELFVLFRTLQVLGAYGLRGLVERKAHFIESIPFALSGLGRLIEDGALDDYPELKRICTAICGLPQWAKAKADGLTVSVFSFSYKKGYPEDYSGNGGGFMFDCRAMHNPGRYEQYKQLTGLDEPVRDFLEERGEIQPFIQSALSLVRPAVARYRQRGFTGLQIGFGCTGGQHRSVYAAQSVAEALAEDFRDVRVELCHREQGISRTYNYNKEKGGER